MLTTVARGLGAAACLALIVGPIVMARWQQRQLRRRDTGARWRVVCHWCGHVHWRDQSFAPYGPDGPTFCCEEHAARYQTTHHVP